MLPTWLKPSYIAIALLAVLAGVQTVRLSGAKADTAREVAAKATLVAQIATARADGLAEGARRVKIAQDALEAAHLKIVAELESDKAEIKKHYDQTYGLLKDLAATPKWACLNDPLPENVLENFRRP